MRSSTTPRSSHSDCSAEFLHWRSTLKVVGLHRRTTAMARDHVRFADDASLCLTATLHLPALFFTQSTGWRFLMLALDSTTRARGDPSTGSVKSGFSHVCHFNNVTKASSSSWGRGSADVLACGHMHQANSGRPVCQSESAEPERGKHTSQTGDCPNRCRRQVGADDCTTQPAACTGAKIIHSGSAGKCCPRTSRR
jgi:hypothetical protein